MVLTPSNMLPLGTLAPDLPEMPFPEGPTVILFICNHCPYVKHLKQGIIDLATDYMPRGIAFVAINANDADAYPEDAPDKMAAEGYPFPYLFDETQGVARAYTAACTPDCYIFNNNKELVYRGQFDDSRPGNGLPVTGDSLRVVLDALLSNQPVDSEQKPSIGCNIKWK